MTDERPICGARLDGRIFEVFKAKDGNGRLVIRTGDHIDDVLEGSPRKLVELVYRWVPRNSELRRIVTKGLWSLQHGEES